MNKLRRIVVGHSLFPDGEVALRSATALAERAKAALYILHVVEPYHVYQKILFPSVPAEAMAEEVVLKMRAQLADLAKSPALAGLHVETDALIGKPFLELIKACRRWNGNLTGSRDKSSWGWSLSRQYRGTGAAQGTSSSAHCQTRADDRP